MIPSAAMLMLYIHCTIRKRRREAESLPIEVLQKRRSCLDKMCTLKHMPGKTIQNAA